MNPAIHRAADRHADQYAVKTAVLNEVRDAFMAGAQVYPIHDGESLVLGPECFATDAPLNDPGPDTKIAWKGVWFGILTDTDPTIGRTVTAREGAGLSEGYILRDKEGDISREDLESMLSAAYLAGRDHHAASILGVPTGRGIY
jgi:hypothetical protein